MPLTPEEEHLFRTLAAKLNDAPTSVNKMAKSADIPATIKYPHEQGYVEPIDDLEAEPPEEGNTFEPIVRPTSDDPKFDLRLIEHDLALVLHHVVNKGQTVYTVENVFIQQVLRVVQRLENRLERLEEIIMDELVDVSSDDDPIDNKKLIMRFDDGAVGETRKLADGKEETNPESEEEETSGRRIPKGSSKSKRRRANAKKRRRNISNSKNSRRSKNSS